MILTIFTAFSLFFLLFLLNYLKYKLIYYTQRNKRHSITILNFNIEFSDFMIALNLLIYLFLILNSIYFYFYWYQFFTVIYYFPTYSMIWSSLALVLIFYGGIHIFSRIIALRYSHTITGIDQLFIHLAFWLAYPAALFMRWLSHIAWRLWVQPFERSSEMFLQNEETVEPDSFLPREDKKMIDSIVELRETLVKEIMAPRIDIFALEISTPLEEIIEDAKKNGHSRIPVYNESIDKIVGILYLKDLFLKNCENQPFQIDSIIREPFFVPETKKVDELLREFKANKIHMAIVVDEYGGTAGLITLEDIIEEIVGEIQDEYDDDEFIIKQLDKNVYLANALMNIEDLNETLQLNIPSIEYDTLGGFIFDQLGSVPEKGQRIYFHNLLLIIDEIVGQRITKVKLILNANPSESETPNK